MIENFQDPNKESSNKCQKSDFIWIKPISRGGASIVYKGKHIAKNQLRAIKCAKTAHYKQIESLEQLQNEQRIFSILPEHPLIIKCFEESDKFITLDYMENGCLYDYIEASNRSFPENLARNYFKSIAKGIHFLHSHNICHLDLKLENILMDANFSIKISDFGFSQQITRDQQKLIKYQGSGYYMSPQVYQKCYDGMKADIFALGVCLYILVTGIPPFTEASESDYFYQLLIQNQQDLYWRKIEKLLEKQIPDDFKFLFESMINVKEEERPSIDEILQSQWLNKEEMLEQDKILIMTDYKKKICY